MKLAHKHILKCQHVGAHKKWYDLVLPMLKKIQQNDLCPVQETFMKCIKSWLEAISGNCYTGCEQCTCNHETLWEARVICSRGLLVLWSSFGSKTMQATPTMMPKTHQCYLVEYLLASILQVRTACNDQSNDVEPILSASHVCKESSQSTWMDWIYLTVCTN
jgi:hypothetical protein